MMQGWKTEPEYNPMNGGCLMKGKLKIELHVIVAYGVSIRAVAQNVLENVRYKIEEFTGLEIEAINVVVEGVRIMDED